MRKGFSNLLIIILIVFLLIPVLFWGYSKYKQRGFTKGAVSAKNGFAITITSNLGTWDLEKYLCKNKTDCLSSLTSGNKLETVSGGRTEESIIYVKYSSTYSDHSHMKIYVKPGWNSTMRDFEIVNIGDVPSTEAYNLEGINIVLIPLQYVSELFNYSAHFSD